MKYQKNLESFNFICILLNCLRYIDFLNLFIFLKKNAIIHNKLKFPSFYFIIENDVSKIIQKLIYFSKNKILNFTILDYVYNFFFKKFILQQKLLFRFSNINNNIIEKFIWNLIRHLNNFIELTTLHNNFEVTDSQFNFLENIIRVYVHTKILNN